MKYLKLKKTEKNRKSKKKKIKHAPIIDETLSEEDLEDQEFKSFFTETLKKFPQKTATVILNSYGKTKAVAGKVLDSNKNRFSAVFNEFLQDVDDETRRKSHRIIHSASLTAAIIGSTPIPFADAFLLVPVQLTMMSRLHKLFGQSWVEGMAKSISKELIVVGLGRSAVGNLLKFVPAVGTVSGAIVNATVASTITEALGWTTVKMLNVGEDIFEQVTSFKGQFKILLKALQGTSKK